MGSGNKAALLSKKTQSSFLSLSAVNIYIYLSIDCKSLISPDPPPQDRTEENTCTGARRALRDAHTMASLVHVAPLHVKPPYFNADNTRKPWNTSQGLCMGSLDLSVLRGHQLPSVTGDPIAEQEECPGTGPGFIALHRLGWAVNLRGGGKRTVSNCNISLWAQILF